MRRRYIIIGGVVLLLSVALLSAAAYLLHYALQPEREAVADTCYQVLCDAGVYKQDEKGLAGLDRFLRTIGMQLK